MLVACKCLNLVVNGTNSTINNQQQTQQQQQQQSLHFDHQKKNEAENTIDFLKIDDAISQYGINTKDFQRLQKSSRIYQECLEFFRQSNGPLKGLQENIVQTDLMYKVPVDPWILFYCANCDTVTHAKHTSDMIYLINSTLLTNEDELNCLKNHQSFSNAFGILIMDRPSQTIHINNKNNDILLPELSAIKTIGGISSSSSSSSLSNDDSLCKFNIDKAKQNRFKNLTDILNNRLQKEIYETDERIRRYTEQQFALLKSFREKSEQEYQILVSLINQVPDELKVIDAIGSNLVASTTNPNGITTTPTISVGASAVAAAAAATTKTTTIKSNDNNTPSLFNLKQQQILNLDTPPATPDSTPMSVGNSPTFRQQTNNPFGSSALSGNMMKSNLIGISGDYNDRSDTDCLFELEGMETVPDSFQLNGTMSDVEETEDAEDALGELDSAIQIPESNYKKSNLNIAKSLPISISSVPDRRFYINELDDEIPEDSNVDIAASIKALAKSVHGDTIFGDLPRPRFSTQI